MDEKVGRNLLRLRGSTSQAALAAAMKQAGHRWSQATVWSTEKGERPLRLSEAASLCEILEVPVNRLLDGVEREDERARMARAAEARDRALVLLAESMEMAKDAASEWKRAATDFEMSHGQQRLMIALKETTRGTPVHLDPEELFCVANDLLKSKERAAGAVPMTTDGKE